MNKRSFLFLALFALVGAVVPGEVVGMKRLFSAFLSTSASTSDDSDDEFDNTSIQEKDGLQNAKNVLGEFIGDRDPKEAAEEIVKRAFSKGLADDVKCDFDLCKISYTYYSYDKGGFEERTIDFCDPSNLQVLKDYHDEKEQELK